MEKITIVKGDVEVSIPRSSLVGVDHTHDGVVFNFKGCHFYTTDAHMPLETKNMIKASVDSFKGDLKVDVTNYKQPVSVVLG